MRGNQNFCIKCGTRLEESDRFCGNCGWGHPGAVPHLVANPNLNIPSSPQRNSSGKVLGVVGVLLLILVSSIVGVWWFKPQVQQSIPAVSAMLPTKLDLSDPKSYLPKENMKYTIHEIYPDSSEQVTLEMVVAKVRPTILATAVEIIPQYEGETAYMSMHYVVGGSGVYMVDDQRPQSSSLWLQNKLTKGMRWEYKSKETTVVWTVQDMGVTCDLGFTKVPDCLVIDYDLGWGNHRFLNYYAPGLGVIMSKDYHSGAVLRSLTGYSEMDSQQAQTLVNQHSRSLDKIKVVK